MIIQADVTKDPFEGKCVSCPSDPAFGPIVFLIDRSRRRPIPSMEWLSAAELTDKNIYAVDSDYLCSKKLGPSVPSIFNFEPNNELFLRMHPFQARELIARSLDGVGYEFGAGPRPIVVPLGCKVIYCDAFNYDKTILGGSYASFAGNTAGFVHIDQIASIDAIDTLTSIPDESSDFMIASHVIEHVRSPIDCLVNAHQKLRYGGHLFLVVPDKDRMFDSLRPVTTLDHLLADFYLPSEERDYEHYLEYNRLSRKSSNFKSQADLEYKANTDIHRHTFTVASFRELIKEVEGICSWSSVQIIPRTDHLDALEFYVMLKK
jgi:SAM-dependent methyltransferase